MTAVRPIRRPLDGLSPYDLEAVQRWAIQGLANEILRDARVTARLLVVHDDHVAELDLDANPQGDPLTTFMALSDHGNVEHRLLCGHVDDGDQRLAWVFGARNDDDRTWWIATRTFRVLPGGLGSSESVWDLTHGVELHAVPFPAASVGRPGEGPMELLPAQPVGLPTVGVRSDDVPPNAQVPTDPVAATNIVAELGHEDEAWRKGLDGVLVVIFREQTLERWHVQGEIPCGLDDLVRNICLQGDTPKAVVTVSLELFEYEETWYRAVKMVSEAGGVRFQRILAMLWSEGDTDQPSHLRYFGSQPAPLESRGWIGVEPVTELELFALGPEA